MSERADPSGHAPAEGVTVREGTPEDQDAVWRLYEAARLGDGDDPSDMRNIAKSYLDHDGSRLWVAQDDEAGVVGLIGVLRRSDSHAELRRLRVDAGHRHRNIGRALIAQALRYCRQRAYLKVTLEAYGSRSTAIALFEEFGFRHARTSPTSEGELAEFYLDLYQSGSGGGG